MNGMERVKPSTASNIHFRRNILTDLATFKRGTKQPLKGPLLHCNTIQSERHQIPVRHPSHLKDRASTLQ